MSSPSPPDATAGVCSSCGAAYEQLQEYCLGCGSRLLPASGLGPILGRAWRGQVSSPGGRLWVALVLLGVTAAATVAAIVASDEGASAVRTIVATEPEPTTTAPVVQPAPELTTSPTTTTTATEPETTTPTPAAPVEWPPGRAGFTVVVNSVPTTRGRETALQQARAAIGAGLPAVGVLDSSGFASLRPGYFVVFSGYYRSIDEARAAVERAQANGYAKAYEREIAP